MDLLKRKAGAQAAGLTDREAAKRLREYGPNVFRQNKKANPAGILAAQFKDILIVILIVSTLLSVLMGELGEAVAILAIVLINALMGFVQEYRTEKTLDALKNMAAPHARVVRGGRVRTVPAAEVVPGDLIVFEAGDRIPSDAAVVEGSELQLDESLLTGESLPVEKAAADAAPRSAREMVYMGTMVTRGTGRALTLATGMSTEMGKIAGMLRDIRSEQTPLQKRLDQLGKYIAVGCLLVCAVVSVTGILRGEPVFNMVITGISLAVAAVPEGLPAIVTIALALGVGRMLKRNALIRRLTAVETLGCASVVCSDKTGTLTENRMTVRQLRTVGHVYEVTGNGGETRGDFLEQGQKASPLRDGELALALEIGAVCSNAELSEEKAGVVGRALHSARAARVTVTGDPTEGALLVACEKAGLSVRKLRGRCRRLAEHPFDSERKCMSVVVALPGGERRLYLKGAPDVVLARCAFAHSGGRTELMTAGLRQKLLRANDRMADGALRVLALAYRELPAGGDEKSAAEKSLVFVGLAGMIDPPRREACHAVHKCLRAGIRPVMITGDHRNTAAAVAKELGILRPGDGVLTGEELDRMSDEDLIRAAPRVSVYARVSPGHKLRIVRAYKKSGNVVAMTGDGVNDAPAVKEADIGVSMGLTGTDVTKEASAIILMDDNFASMIAAVEEGRVIYSNIRKFIRYLLSCNIGEVLTMFVGMLMGLPIVLLPIQILMVNLVTDGLPAIALGLEPPEKDVMERAPRGAKESVFSDGLAGTMIFRGCVIGLSTLGAFVSVLSYSGDVATARTAAFLTLVVVQLIHVFECKSETHNLFQIPIFNNMYLILSCLLSLALTLAVIFIPFFRPFFSTVPLTFRECAWVLGYSFIGPVLSVPFVHGRRRFRRAG